MPGAGCLSIHSDFTHACPMFPGFVAPAMHGKAPGTGHRLRLVRNCHWRSVKSVSSSMPIKRNSAP